MIDNAFNLQSATLIRSAALLAVLPAEVAPVVTSGVPEPTGVAEVAVAVAGLLGQRRRDRYASGSEPS